MVSRKSVEKRVVSGVCGSKSQEKRGEPSAECWLQSIPPPISLLCRHPVQRYVAAKSIAGHVIHAEDMFGKS
jgi:hypothetical protein